jgi:hypothetical protein
MSRIGGGAPAPRPGSDSRFGGAGASAGRNLVQQVLPEWPLSQESSEGDWRFSVKFTVQLVRPEDARKAEKSDLNLKRGSKDTAHTQPEAGK